MGTPYQMSDGGAQASAMPIYHMFIEQAKKLKPRYLTMITPSRWFSGGKGLDEFRKRSLADRSIRIIHDYPNASDCFPNVDIKGGVNYFLWDRDNKGDCEIITHNGDEIISKAVRPLLEKDCDIFIRKNELVSIYHKVNKFKPFSHFNDIISTRKPYGLTGDVFKDPAKYHLPIMSSTPFDNGFVIYGLLNNKRTKMYVDSNYPLPKKDNIQKFKLFITEAYGSGEFGEIPSSYIIGKPGDCCTETFLEVGPFNSLKEVKNCKSYMQTKFFRTMVGIKKNTQHTTKDVYSFVPMQDFSKPWTDEELYKKYNLSQDEIDFIETNVKAMDGDE